MKANFAITCLFAWLTMVGICAGQVIVEIENVVPDAANDALQDDDGDTPAYIVLRNNNSQSPTNITNWFLTDDAANPTKWQIRGVNGGQVFIPAGGTLSFFASGKDRVTQIGDLFVITIYHTNFTYPCNVPYCQLTSSQGGFIDSYTNLTDRCCDGITLVGEGSVVRYHVPTEDIGDSWKSSGFVDREWSRGVLGLGYDPGGNPFCNDLVLHFTMDRLDVSSTVISDVSGSPNVHDGASTGAPVIGGLINEAIEMRDTSSGVRVTHHPELEPGTGDFSVSMWIRPERDLRAVTEMLIGKGDLAAGETGWRILRTGQGILFELRSDRGFYRVNNLPVPANEWAHIAMIVKGDSQFRTYVNGSEQEGESFAGGDRFSSDADLFLGLDAGGESRFIGSLDEVMIWNRLLDPREVSDILETGFELRLSVKDPQAGFDSGSLFGECIRTDVEAEMKGVNSTLYVRAPFALGQYPAGFNKMSMRVKYDDGFVCYLNGGEILRRNAPEIPATLTGVRSITFKTNQADWFYLEELQVENTGGVDVASTSFGATASHSGTPAFGSQTDGAIDDSIGNCCGTGWHSDNANAGNFYTITLPSPQDITGQITVWNRQDGCCPERLDDFSVTYHSGPDGTGSVIASQDVVNLSFDSGGAISGPGGASFPVFPQATAPAWNSAAATARNDNTATNEELIDLSAFVPLLRQGGNLLAIHALNRSADADRFLIAPELCIERGGGQPGNEDCVKTTNGTDFWLAFPENYEEEPGAPLELRVTIAGPRLTTGTITLPGFPGAPGFPRNFTIPGSGIVEFVIPKQVELEGAEEIALKGVHIVASRDVAVYGRNRMDFSTDSFLGLPTTCLGTEYFVLGYNTVHGNEPLLHGTQFGIVAPFDDTMITITPNENVGSKPAGVPYNVKLHRGETYQLRNEAGQPADLTGTLIASDKPVGVFGSHRCANIASGTTFFCDFITEQLLPTNSWGVSFHVAPLRTRLGDSVRIISSENNNLVTILNASSPTSFTLQRGEHRTIELTEPTRISCRGKALVAQYSNSADADGVVMSDPFMVLIQPDPNWLDAYRFSIPPVSVFGGSYLTVVANSSAQLNSILLDATFVPAVPGVVIGTFTTGKVWATLPVSPGAHSMSGFAAGGGAIPFGLTVYGFDTFDSYGFPGGMTFNDNAPPIIICPPELTLECPEGSTGADCFIDVPNFRVDPAVVFAIDTCDGVDINIGQSPEEGSPLGLGEHTVTFTAFDSSGNSSTCTMTLHIVESWDDQVFSEPQQNDPSISGPFVDFDGDGFVNALEEKNGTDPTDPMNVPLFEVSFDTDYLLRDFMKIRVRRPVLPHPATEAVLEGTGDLFDWRSGPDIFEEIVSETTVLPGGQYEEVSFKVLETVGAPIFKHYYVRWKVIGP